MSEAKGQQEPSMEEILASIRRIIAEDSDTAKAPIQEPEPLPIEEEDVLSLDIESVTCRWCGRSNAIESLPDEENAPATPTP